MSDQNYLDLMKSRCQIAPETACWEYQGYIHPKGYGILSYRGKAWRTHRLSYFLNRGPIPEGMVICHTCDNRKCCNPLHLFLGTFDINNKDMAAKSRCKYSVKAWPACKHGHEFTPENTWICKNGWRHCKECGRIKGRRYWADGSKKERLLRYRAAVRAKKALTKATQSVSE